VGANIRNTYSDVMRSGKGMAVLYGVLAESDQERRKSSWSGSSPTTLPHSHPLTLTDCNFKKNRKIAKVVLWNTMNS